MGPVKKAPAGGPQGPAAIRRARLIQGCCARSVGPAADAPNIAAPLNLSRFCHEGGRQFKLY